MKILFITLLSLMFFEAYSQKNVLQETETGNEVFAKYEVWQAQADTANLDVSLQKIIAGAKPQFAEKENTLEKIFEKQSPFTMHVAYEQKYVGVSVYNAGLKVNMKTNGQVLSVFDYTLPQRFFEKSFPLADFPSATANDSVNRYIRQHFEQVQTELARSVWYSRNEHCLPAYQLKIYDGQRRYEEIVFDANHVYVQRDLNMYLTDTATVQIFLPDPLTSSSNYYGGFYVDSGDFDLSTLNAERVPAKIICDFDGINYNLRNSYVRMLDWDVPNLPIPTSLTPDFSFTRDEDGFESAMAMYYLTDMNFYWQNLGYAVAGFQIQVDPQGGNGSDNSYFNVAVGIPRMNLGVGGVDDGEDADVIIHEYGHAVSYDVNNSNTGSERQALDEGWGDYMACTYGRPLNEFRWNEVFTWDGHNEFWGGRNTNLDNRYPDDKTGSIHYTGQIYSGALMDIYDLLGKNTTDKLAIQSLYSWASGMSMKQAGKLILQSDTVLYAGSHFCVLYNVLLNRGLIDTMNIECLTYDENIPCTAGNDTVICGSQFVQLGAAAVPGYIYEWSPANYLDNANLAQPTANVQSSTSFSLRVISPDGLRFNQCAVNVYVSHCEPEPTLYNSDAFAKGTGNAILELPADMAAASVGLYDARGRKLKMYDASSRIITIQPGELTEASVYFLYAVDGKKRYSFKLLRY